jgi:acetolactate decarboxylase
VDSLRREGLAARGEPHEVFQTSTVDALFEGRFDGDVSFAELARQGDFGIGTLDALDGEMIALEGRFLRADFDGHLSEIGPSVRTPFAVVTFFRPGEPVVIEGPLDHHEFVTELNRRGPRGVPACAVRIDGSFELVQARSVPRQEPPYPSLTEVAHHQHVFELRELEATLVGFRFPPYAEGLEVPGYHLHVVDAERRRGGHVLAARPRRVEARFDRESELHLELPPGVELGAGGHGAEIREAEGG